MEIINHLDFSVKNSAVSLGKFDGIHQGHRLLLRQILEQKGLVPTVFTFGAAQGNGIIPKQQIYSRREKEMILQQLGIEREIIFPFNEETRAMDAEDFVREILINKIDAKYICVGEDFHFGRGREGNIALLEHLQQEYGYRLQVLPKLVLDDEVVSSTRIRWELSGGRLEKVNELLGSPYFIAGEVVHGNALGRTLGMPTANLVPDSSKVLPAYGVYATLVELEGKTYVGVTNIGLKPTVGAENASVETTILDFQEDIYGKELKVSFYYFLRREKKFPNLSALTLQMEKDKKQAMQLMYELGVGK